MNKRIRNLKQLLKSRYFLKNFSLLFGMISVFFLIFATYTYRNSGNIITKEFLSSGKYNCEVIARSMDDYMMDMRYISAALETNELVRTFFTSEDPDSILTGVYPRLQESLKSYNSSFSSLDSIYLYSEKNGIVLTANERTPIKYFTDHNWLEKTDHESGEFQIFSRAKNNMYPFVLTLMKPLNIDGYNAAIVINILPGNISAFINAGNESYQDAYLISDEGHILFRNQQRELLEPLSTVPVLNHFKEGKNEHAILVNDSREPFTFIQIHSKQYNWNYVLVTHLQEYTFRLSDSRAILTTLLFLLLSTGIITALFFTIHSFKPISELVSLLENPESIVTIGGKSDKEIKFIAEQITSYIQTNQKLSDELAERLNLLNETRLLALQSQINPHFLFNTLNMIRILELEALGYQHPIPKLTLSLSKLLRYGIDSTDLVSLSTELDYTKMYLNLLNQRYGNKLMFVSDIDPDTLFAKVPKLIIQPLIENAVFHGLSKKAESGGKLHLSTRQENGLCIVTLKDNGVGMSSETLKLLRAIIKEPTPPKGSIGLKNIVIRMSLLYGDNFQMEIDSAEQEGSVFRLQFPMIT